MLGTVVFVVCVASGSEEEQDEGPFSGGSEFHGHYITTLPAEVHHLLDFALRKRALSFIPAYVV